MHIKKDANRMANSVDSDQTAFSDTDILSDIGLYSLLSFICQSKHDF